MNINNNDALSRSQGPHDNQLCFEALAVGARSHPNSIRKIDEEEGRERSDTERGGRESVCNKDKMREMRVPDQEHSRWRRGDLVARYKFLHAL